MRYLYQHNETIELSCDSVIRRHPYLSDGTPVADGRRGEKIGPLQPGHYLIREIAAPGQEQERYLAVIGDRYTVMQLTIGSFTSDNFDHPLHSVRIPGNYYVSPRQLDRDSSFRGYQQEYGDNIIPHVMANSLGIIDPALAQTNPNWDCLTAEEIVVRLRRLDAWWQDCGFKPLRGIATYTPSNSLIQAMKTLGWDILHSIIPEQNWSDGRWCINHWGMVNQPFYVGDDDFRKPVERSERNVLAMTMDSYHLYMPHVVHFGDNVLSPSHFLRWHRSVESGPEPERFTNFLVDYLQVARQHPEPFFLIAGFEFGRTFGVRSMTTHNRRGMERIIELAKNQPLVFATAADVAEYYKRFRPRPRPAVFTQRDYLAGTRIMDKPINSGPSIGMEMEDFKAVFAHLESLPYYHYDYNEKWQYAYDDMDIPADYAQHDCNVLQVRRAGPTVVITADTPLPRAVPVALWDAKIVDPKPEFAIWHPPVLDDGRHHTVLIVPTGWSGTVEITLNEVSKPAIAEFCGLVHPQWRVQEIGEGERRHCFLYLEELLPAEVEIPFRVPAACRIDSREKVLGDFQAGDMITLRFDNRHSWYRFWGLTPAQIQPDRDAVAILDRLTEESRRFFDTAPELLRTRQVQLDNLINAMIPASQTRLFHLDCFGNCVMGERSRAVKFDRLVYRNVPAIKARELSDGGMAFNPGFNCWVHPRSLHFEIDGLTPEAVGAEEVVIHLFSLSPNDQNWRYIVTLTSGEKTVFESSLPWECPKEPVPSALLSIPVKLRDIVDGHLDGFVRSAQRGVLDDWFRDGGFIATLQRLIVTTAG